MTRVIAGCLGVLLAFVPVTARAQSVRGTGKVTAYGWEGCARPTNCVTADGTPFNPQNLGAAASQGWMRGRTVRLTNPRTGRSVTVKVNDWCPSCAGYGIVLDLTMGTFAALGMAGTGTIEYEFDPSVVIVEPATLMGSQTYLDDGCPVHKQIWERAGRTWATYDPAC